VIGILDYGIGNPRSIFRMCETLGLEVQVVSSNQELEQFSRLILPGVGSFDSCAKELRKSGLDSALIELAGTKGVPLLGICVGAQLLGVSSEEGNEAGLGLMSHTTVRLQPTTQPVPHMGWRQVDLSRIPNLHSYFVEAPRFYFSHSYVIKAASEIQQFGTFEYEETLNAVLIQKNIVAVQFHPEKSHRFGRKLIDWFGAWTP
jgi:glutamine amidotransferase